MKPGYLHLDVGLGATAELINAALCGLLSETGQIKKIWESYGLRDCDIQIKDDAIANIAGKRFELWMAGVCLIGPPAARSVVKSILKNRPLWDLGSKISEKKIDAPLALNLPRYSNQNQKSSSSFEHFLTQCFFEESMHFSELRSIFSSISLPTLSLALADRIMNGLWEESGAQVFAEGRISGSEALWIFSQTVLFVSLIEALGPKYVTATKIPCFFAEESDAQTPHTFLIQNKTWLMHILQSLPTIEREHPKPQVDVLGVAFLKSLVGHFGLRGESTILKMAVGLQNLTPGRERHLCRALWCEAIRAPSMAEPGPTALPKISFLFSVSGLISPHVNLSTLVHHLSALGAKHITVEQVLDAAHAPRSRVSFLVADEQRQAIFEAFLVIGGAQELCCSQVENHSLRKRMVAVPVGYGQKEHLFRLTEWLFGEKIVRAEPIEEDLQQYMKLLSAPPEVARADLLMAWKKWRGRHVEPQGLGQNDQTQCERK